MENLVKKNLKHYDNIVMQSLKLTWSVNLLRIYNE